MYVGNEINFVARWVDYRYVPTWMYPPTHLYLDVYVYRYLIFKVWSTNDGQSASLKTAINYLYNN